MANRFATFEIFVSQAVQKLLNDASWSRTKDLKKQCAEVLDFVKAEKNVSPPLPQDRTATILQLLQTACDLNLATLQETCLGLLHKLVAYAWLQGETTSAGSLKDVQNPVCKAVHVVTTCADSTQKSVHLAVIQALLTIATSEHFVPHGETLVQCLKVVFNLAIATEDELVTLTAQNALLQMCNTVVRQTVNANAYPDAERRSESMMTTSELNSRQPSVHAGSTSLSGGVRGFSPQAGRGGTSRTAQLFALADQCDLQGLEAAFEGMQSPQRAAAAQQGASPRPPTATATSQSVEAESHGKDAHATPQKAPAPGDGLSGQTEVTPASDGAPLTTQVPTVKVPRVDVLEADLIVLMNALCRLAARRQAGTDADLYVKAGKKLASDILMKVFESPGNPWGALSQGAWVTLRQPVCMVLLRSATVGDESGFAHAPRLFAAILCRTPLKYSLKAELGAFFPLLVHKPLELEDAPLSSVASALEASARMASDAQLLVDLFVNYDCDLQAVNIFERWMHGLQRASAGGEGNSTERGATLRAASISCMCAVLRSLDAWVMKLDGVVEPRVVESVDGPVDAPAAGSRSEYDIEEAKAMKDKRAAGITLFSTKPLKAVRLLQKSHVVGQSAEEVAQWLRAHLHILDRDALGELFGLPDPEAVAIMHEYINQEDFADVPLDIALRRLLHEFKLPGEAQQIDRIMEKFAEAFCRTNSGVFRAAEDAYRLAFATVMLNTDVHNPLADHMLSFDTFVEMNSDTQDDGSSLPVLSEEDLQGIFDRISAQEIQMVGKPTSNAAASMNASTRKQPLLNPGRLAAALGLSNIITKLKAPALAAPAVKGATRVPKLGVSSARWHSASSSQHVRSILQVSSLSILETLREGLRMGAQSPKVYVMALTGLRLAIRMSCASGHHAFTDDAISMLCTATGVYSPAPPGSAHEARQLKALQTVFDVALGPEGLILGSSWWLVLRCVSVLEAMADSVKAARTPSAGELLSPTSPNSSGRSPTKLDSAEPARLSTPASDMISASLAPVEEQIKSALSVLTSWVQSAASAEAGSSSLQRSHDALFNPSPRRSKAASPPGPSAAAAGASPSASSPSLKVVAKAVSGALGSPRAALQRTFARNPALSEQPGAALRAWACSSEGSEAIDAVFARSAALDGQNVVQFFRALCAVSNQELQPLAGAPPRVTSLRRLTESLFFNIDRIRLVWGRVWAVVSPHYVAAVCSEHVDVAMVAIDSLKQLASHVLQRSELTLFNWQQQALEPFVQTLRHAGDPSLRCMALNCLQHFLQKYPNHLGSGWTKVIQGIQIALMDRKLAVVEEGLKVLEGTLQAAVAADVFPQLQPAIIGLCVTAATLEEQPHLCFAALACIERVADVLLHQQVGTSAQGGAVLTEPDEGYTPHSAPSSTAEGAPAVGMELLLPSHPWLAPLQESTSTPWSGVVHAYALIATRATNDTVAEQGVEEAMRLLHKCSGSWTPATLQASLVAVHKSLFAGNLVPAVRAGECVRLDAHTLQRLLARFQTYLPSLWTLLVAEYSSVGVDTLCMLLDSLLALLHVDSMEAVQVGVAALHQMSVVLASTGAAELDTAGWQGLTDMLSVACSMDQVTAVPLQQRRETVVMVQRSISQILSQCGVCMPPSFHLQLLQIVQESVLRAAAANRVVLESQEEVMRAQAAPPVADDLRSDGNGQVPKSIGTSGTAVQSKDIGPSAADVRSPLADAKVQIEPATSVQIGPENGVGHHSSGDEHSPAFCSVVQGVDNFTLTWLEQQNEGGKLLIKSYLVTIDLFKQSAARSRTLVEAAECAAEAEKRFAALCSEVVTAMCSAHSNGAAQQPPGAVEWSTKHNAPVLCALLRAIRKRGVEEAWAKVVMPYLPLLIRSGDNSVRTAVASVYEHIVGPQLMARSS